MMVTEVAVFDTSTQKVRAFVERLLFFLLLRCVGVEPSVYRFELRDSGGRFSYEKNQSSNGEDKGKEDDALCFYLVQSCLL